MSSHVLLASCRFNEIYRHELLPHRLRHGHRQRNWPERLDLQPTQPGAKPSLLPPPSPASPTGVRPMNRIADPHLLDLVDALVEAIDINRAHETQRVRSALEPFGATALFDAELRLNGAPSIDEWCICGGEVLMNPLYRVWWRFLMDLRPMVRFAAERLPKLAPWGVRLRVVLHWIAGNPIQALAILDGYLVWFAFDVEARWVAATVATVLALLESITVRPFELAARWSVGVRRGGFVDAGRTTGRRSPPRPHESRPKSARRRNRSLRRCFARSPITRNSHGYRRSNGRSSRGGSALPGPVARRPRRPGRRARRQHLPRVRRDGRLRTGERLTRPSDHVIRRRASSTFDPDLGPGPFSSPRSST